MELFEALGFRWDRAAVTFEAPRGGRERAVFRLRRMLPEFVWDASVLEGNPFTFPEVKTLLEGVTVGGRKLSDQEQILNLAESAKRLIALVTEGEFALDKARLIEGQSTENLSFKSLAVNIHATLDQLKERKDRLIGLLAMKHPLLMNLPKEAAVTGRSHGENDTMPLSGSEDRASSLSGETDEDPVA